MTTIPDDKKLAFTFNDLPQVMGLVLERLDNIERLLADGQALPEQEELMDAVTTAKFLNLSIATLYTKVCRGEIPALKPGKRLYFDKKELVEWIKSARKKSNDEISKEATFLLNRGRVPFHRKRRAMR